MDFIDIKTLYIILHFILIGGDISVVSWSFAIILGSLKSVPYSFEVIILVYLITISFAVIVALSLKKITSGNIIL